MALSVREHTIEKKKARHIPMPVRRISLVPVIRWAKNFERAASFVKTERLIEASRTRHSNA